MKIIHEYEMKEKINETQLIQFWAHLLDTVLLY